jgi:7-carboxy-7-deazaguanine synthase (Cx14CxxC type)
VAQIFAGHQYAAERRASDGVKAAMTYRIKEIFYTLQGEGAQVGRPAVFCRFSLCNLWTGREQDRHRAICQFCDTDFTGTDGPGGGVFHTADELAAEVSAHWPASPSGSVPGARRYVVCTGGEPLLQLDAEAVAALHRHGFEVAIETNGTRHPPAGIDWICVSPKAGAPLRLTAGQELKLVFPQSGAPPTQYETLAFSHFLLQPMDGPDLAANTRAAVEYCLAHPRWRLSLQTHKILGIR